MIEGKMHTYRYALSITSQFYFCGVPFRLDTSPKCALNCAYCFAMSRGGRRTSTRLIADPESLGRKLDPKRRRSQATGDINSELIDHGQPVHFGGISDPFSNAANTKVSLELLNILAEASVPTVLSTKNTDELLSSTTLNVLSRLPHLVIQISFTTSDSKTARVLEPRAPSPKSRMSAAKQLTKHGYHLIARLQPLFPSLISEAQSDLIPQLSQSGFRHVVVEFAKFPVERTLSCFDKAIAKLGWDDIDYYRRNGRALVGREWMLPTALKWQLLQPIIASIHRGGMTFGAGDYGLNHLGDTDCCCGISEVPGFENWYRGNLSYILRKALPGEVTFRAVTAEWSPEHSIRFYMNSHCRLKSENSMSGYLRDKWNRPGTTNAPDTYLGITNSGKTDEYGDVIYHKDFASSLPLK